MRTPRQSNYRQETFSETTPRPSSSGKSLLSFQSRQQPIEASKSSGSIHVAKVEPYDLADAYQSTIEQFNNAKSPYQKLGHLFALELLIVASLSYPDSCSSPLLPSSSSTAAGPSSDFDGGLGKRRASGAVTCEEPLSPRAFTPGTDAIVNEIENLFRQPQVIRPRNLLRDMQLIAAFIPGSILDLRDDGKAFWDMTMAIGSLKKSMVEYVVKKGSQLVEVGESTQGSQEEIDRSGSRPIIQDDEERVRMAEAVRLFTIGKNPTFFFLIEERDLLVSNSPRQYWNRCQGIAPGCSKRTGNPVHVPAHDPVRVIAYDRSCCWCGWIAIPEPDWKGPVSGIYHLDLQIYQIDSDFCQD